MSDSQASSDDDQPLQNGGKPGSSSPPKRSWEELKAIGTECFKAGDYDEAIQFYTSSLEILMAQQQQQGSNNSAVLLSNRAMCHIKRSDFVQAEQDARKSVEHDPEFIKPILRLGQALCGIGRFDDAVAEFTRGLAVARARKDTVAVSDLSESLRDAQAASRAVAAAKAHLAQQYQQQQPSTSSPTSPDAAPAASSYSSPPSSPTTTSLTSLVKSVADAYLKYDDCFSLALIFAELQAPVDPEKAAAVLARLSSPQSALRTQCENSADFVYARALVAYHGNASTGTANAQQLLRSAMELDPDNVKIQRLFKKVRTIETKKQAGNDAYKERRWQQAVDLYSEAISLDGSNKRLCGVLFGNRSAAKMELNDNSGALRDIDAAIDRGNDAAKIYARRSKIYEKLGKFDEAKQDLAKAAELDEEKYGGKEMREFEERMRIAKRKNYYDILGVPKTVPADQLKSAYKKEAFKWHPDKWAHASEDEQRAAEIKFKEVQEAFSLLSDPQKRHLYDSGRIDNETDDPRMRGGGGGGGFGGMGGMGGGVPVDLAEMMGMFGGGGGRRRGGGGGMPPGFSFGF